MNNNKKYFTKKSIFKIFGIIIAIIIMWFMISDFIKNWNNIKPYLKNMNISLFILSILIYAGAFILVGYNWSYILWNMDNNNSKYDYLDIHMTSALARYIPGGIWNMVGKAVMCTKLNVDKSKTTISMILEYVFQIISSALFLLFFLPVIFIKDFNWWILIGFIAIIVSVFIFMPQLIKIGMKIVLKVFKTEYNFNFSKRYIYNVLSRFVLAWLVTGVGLVILVKAFTDVKVMQGIFLVLSYPVCWVAGFLSPSPNGMGVREGVLKYLLGLLNNGYSHELIILVILISRIWTILGEAVAFITYKIIYLIIRKKRGRNEEVI